MLSLGLKPGDYMVLGENVVLQYTGTDGNLGKLLIGAPREIPIVRGKVWEKQGHDRPAGLYEGPVKHHSAIRWGKQKEQALQELRTILDGMGEAEQLQAARDKLDFLFPPEEEVNP